MCQTAVVENHTVSKTSLVDKGCEWTAPRDEDFSTWAYPSRDPALIEKLKAIKLKPEAFPEVVVAKPKAKAALTKFIERYQDRFETKSRETKQAFDQNLLRLNEVKNNIKERVEALTTKGMQRLPHGKDHGDGLPISLMWDLIHSC